MLAAMWQYGRREIPYLARAIMELSLFVPFCLAFMPWARYWSPWVFTLFALCLMLIPFNLIRWMSLADLSLGTQRRVLLLGLLTTLLLAVRTLLYEPTAVFDLRWVIELFAHVRASGYPFWARDFAVIGIVLYLWWRGIRLTTYTHDVDTLGLQFRVRALLFAPLVVYLASTRLAWNITPYIVLFCLTSLLMLAIVRAEQMEERATGLAFPMTPRWMGLIALACLAVCLAGVLAASATTAESVLGPAQTAVRFMSRTIFYMVANLLGPLFFVLLNYLSAVLSLALAPIARALSEFSLIRELVPPEELQVEPEIAPEQIIDLRFLPAVILAAVVLLAVVGIIWTWRRTYRQTALADGERLYDSTLSPVLTQEEGIWQRLRNLWPNWRDWRTAASIRRIYRQMVYAATAQGYPRHAATTPFEYLEQLARLWPENKAETELITHAFVRIRYGELPETADELQEIYHAWQQLAQNLSEKQA